MCVYKYMQKYIYNTYILPFMPWGLTLLLERADCITSFYIRDFSIHGCQGAPGTNLQERLYYYDGMHPFYLRYITRKVTENSLSHYIYNEKEHVYHRLKFTYFSQFMLIQLAS